MLGISCLQCYKQNLLIYSPLLVPSLARDKFYLILNTYLLKFFQIGQTEIPQTKQKTVGKREGEER